jgi:hypothetical protein
MFKTLAARKYEVVEFYEVCLMEILIDNIINVLIATVYLMKQYQQNMYIITSLSI